MADTNRSSKVGSAAGRMGLAVMLAVLLMAAAAPARAAAPQKREKGRVTYIVHVFPPGPVTLCPGETRQFVVKIQKTTTRIVNGKPVVGKARPAPGQKIKASVEDQQVGTITPASGQSSRLRWAAGGLSPDVGASFTFTAGEKGSTTITFAGKPMANQALSDELALLDPSSVTVDVNVDCTYKLSIFSKWLIPGPDVQHFGTLNLVSVELHPGEDGSFSTSKAATGSVVRIAAACGGGDTMGTGSVTVEGNVNSRGVVHVTATYPSGGYSGSEGCAGKTEAGTQTPQPLSFDVDTSSGSPVYSLQVGHTLAADVTVTAPATVFLHVLRGP